MVWSAKRYEIKEEFWFILSTFIFFFSKPFLKIPPNSFQTFFCILFKHQFIVQLNLFSLPSIQLLWFIRNDEKIKKFIEDIGINIDIVIALIQRTAYPYKGKIAEHAERRIEDLVVLYT